MISVIEYFDVVYGANLELANLELDSKGINFVSRSAGNNGVVARVSIMPDISPNPSGTISVAAGGSVMESFLQREPYYSGRDLFYLKPIIPLSDKQKLYYCMCLRANKYRYNYGRQANKTLRELRIPSLYEMPDWVERMELPHNLKDDSIVTQTIEINIKQWKPFSYEHLFDIQRGKGPRKYNLENGGKTPFITSTNENNGLVGYTSSKPTHAGNVITVNRNGSVGEAYYQENPFCSTEDVHIFVPKFKLNKYIALFLTTLIKMEKYRYNYGRKWGLERMKETIIKLPVDINGYPNWLLMENFIKSLPYTSNLIIYK